MYFLFSADRDHDRNRKSSGSTPKAHVVHSSSSSASSSRRESSSSTSKKESGQEIRKRKQSFSSVAPSPSPDSKKVDKNTRIIRDMTTKGLKDALKFKISKEDEIKIEDEKLDELVKSIERELYVLYNRDPGMKYKSKYRCV